MASWTSCSGTPVPSSSVAQLCRRLCGLRRSAAGMPAADSPCAAGKGDYQQQPDGGRCGGLGTSRGSRSLLGDRLLAAVGLAAPLPGLPAPEPLSLELPFSGASGRVPPTARQTSAAVRAGQFGGGGSPASARAYQE